MRRGGLVGLMIAGVMAGAAGARAQVVVAPGATGVSVNVETLNTGTLLDVGASVSPDGRYVTVDVDVQSSALQGSDTYSFSQGGGNGIGAQALAIRKLPFRPAVVGRVTMVEVDKKLLLTQVGAMEMKGVSLKGAVRKVAEAGKLNVVLGTRGLGEAGVDVEKPGDFVVKAGTVKEALLGLVKAAAPETDMVITAEDKVITVVTQAQADNAVVTKTYYLQDLLANVPRFVKGDTDVGKIGREERAEGKPETIGALITSTVRPEIWKVNGGKVGEIAVVGNRVTIKAPQSVHALLEGPRVYNPDRVPMYVGYGQ